MQCVLTLHLVYSGTRPSEITSDTAEYSSRVNKALMFLVLQVDFIWIHILYLVRVLYRWRCKLLEHIATPRTLPLVHRFVAVISCSFPLFPVVYIFSPRGPRFKSTVSPLSPTIQTIQ